MPRFRPRHLLPAIQKGLKFSSRVALLGHRQVGKTTLASHICRSYYTLDLRATRDLIENDPNGFLESIESFPTVLDEAQFLPELFPALKEQVRRNRRPGQFILTGSVRFTSRKKILESLTGRIIYYELLPLEVSEIYQIPLPKSLVKLTGKLENLNFPIPPKKDLISQYLKRGGLPGVFATRESSLFEKKMATQMETILERDLKLILDTPLSYQTLHSLYSYFARHQGEPLEITTASSATRISRPTIMKLLHAFHSLFLLRSLPTEGSEKKRVYFLEDQGEATHLIGNRTEPLFDLTRFLYANLRCQLHYRPELQGEIFQFRTRSGGLVPLAFRVKQAEIGIIPILENYPSPHALGSASSFLKAYPKGKIVFATAGKKQEILSPRTMILPANILTVN